MEKGCKLRDSCPAYLAKTVYRGSLILSSDFDLVCDSAPSEAFVLGFCPMYDIQSKIFGVIQESLKTANDSLKTTLEGLSKKP